jgi:hypothetical protein
MQDPDGSDYVFSALNISGMRKRGKIQFLCLPNISADGKMRLLREMETHPFRFRIIHVDPTLTITGTYTCPVEDADDALDSIDFNSFQAVNTTNKVFAFGLERKADGLPRRYDGTFIFDGYLDHNKIIDYLERLEEKV